MKGSTAQDQNLRSRWVTNSESIPEYREKREEEIQPGWPSEAGMARIQANVAGNDLQFETAPSRFSPTRLDRGSLALLSRVTFDPDDKVLDLGCGYGSIGIYAAKLIGGNRVWMIDKDPLAVRFPIKNCTLNGVEAIVRMSDGFGSLAETGFTKIICNPPYHVDFSVPKHFIEKGFNRLVVGGAMYLVTKRRAWYERKLRSIFGAVRVRKIDSYFVFEATKQSSTYAPRAL